MSKLLFFSLILNLLLLISLGFLIIRKYPNLLSGKKKATQELPSHYHTKNGIHRNMPSTEKAIVFAGNSIIEFCDWSELLSNPQIINRGIAGDHIAGLGLRIPDIAKTSPAKFFLLIGTNDLAAGRNLSEILEDYENLVAQIKREMPETKLYLQSIIPSHSDPSRRTEDIQYLNQGIQAIATKNDLQYIDVFSVLADENHELNRLYSDDGVHPNGMGYFQWKLVLQKYVD